MLQVTQNATAFLSAILSEAQDGNDEILRLIITADGVGLVIDNANEDDQTFAHDGKDVLAVSSDVGETLDGRTLDSQETEDSVELTLT